MRSGSRLGSPSCPASVTFAVTTLTCLVGCSTPELYVRTQPGPGPATEPRPSRAWIVVVTREPPPPGAVLLGELAFIRHVHDLPVTLSQVRVRARRMGGDLVASLRCRPEMRYLDTNRFDFEKSEPISPGDRLHCYAKVYRVP